MNEIEFSDDNRNILDVAYDSIDKLREENWKLKNYICSECTGSPTAPINCDKRKEKGFCHLDKILKKEAECKEGKKG